MSLENLARIGRLKAHAPTRTEIVKLLVAAARNLRDASHTENSASNRYTCAYTAIMQAAQAALFANGYRPSTSESGHQMTMVQSLVHSIGLDPRTSCKYSTCVNANTQRPRCPAIMGGQ